MLLDATLAAPKSIFYALWDAMHSRQPSTCFSNPFQFGFTKRTHSTGILKPCS